MRPESTGKQPLGARPVLQVVALTAAPPSAAHCRIHLCQTSQGSAGARCAARLCPRSCCLLLPPLPTWTTRDR